MRFYSPLRYPGGKNKLAKYIALLCSQNKIDGHYIEAYAGGASVAIYLLVNGYVKNITVNDLDRSIYAFWHSVLNDTKKFCRMIEETELTIDNWRYQRMIQFNKDAFDLIELGFSTFFLNRTNRSGIISGGVIGGVTQNGNYKMSCRFNKGELIERIKFIALHKKFIQLYNLDALDIINKITSNSKSKNVIFYFDPPYYVKGQSLYMNSYGHEDHKKVSEKIRSIRNAKWIVSYDNTPEIKELYNKADVENKDYSFTHTAYEPREGQEVLFFSKNLIIPSVSEPTKL